MLIPLKICAYFNILAYLVLPFSAFGVVGSTTHTSSANPAITSDRTAHSLSSPFQTYNTYWQDQDVDVSCVQPNRKLLALTFDDAPASTLEEIVAVFLSYNQAHPDAPASATIFCNGARITPATATAVAAATALGFELGNHTQHHYDLSILTREQVQQEIERTDKLLYPFDKRHLHLLRTPYGKLSDDVRLTAKTPIIDWFIDTNDWTGISEEEIYDAVWQNKSDGAIVLMHDGYPNTVDALKRLLPDLYKAGYQAVGVSQMAKAHGCKLKVGCVYTRARKQGKKG